MSFFDRKILVFLGLLLTVILVGSTVLRSAHQQWDIDPAQLSGEYNANEAVGVFHRSPVVSPAEAVQGQQVAQVLGTEDETSPEEKENKWIEVDLTNQSVYAFEGDKLVYHFIISSGRWGRTPTGTFRIWGKFRYTKMEGGSKALNTYYYLPNVPYVMFFSNDEVPASRGFSFHGTYWHDNFGFPMSHGCINMKTEEAGLLYDWAQPNIGDLKSGRATEDNPGTKVVIYGVAPKE